MSNTIHLDPQLDLHLNDNANQSVPSQPYVNDFASTSSVQPAQTVQPQPQQPQSGYPNFSGIENISNLKEDLMPSAEQNFASMAQSNYPMPTANVSMEDLQEQSTPQVSISGSSSDAKYQKLMIVALVLFLISLGVAAYLAYRYFVG